MHREPICDIMSSDIISRRPGADRREAVSYPGACASPGGFMSAGHDIITLSLREHMYPLQAEGYFLYENAESGEKLEYKQ